MSRYPYTEDEPVHMDTRVVQVVCSSMVVTPVVESLPAVDVDVVHAFEDPGQVLAR